MAKFPPESRAVSVTQCSVLFIYARPERYRVQRCGLLIVLVQDSLRVNVFFFLFFNFFFHFCCVNCANDLPPPKKKDPLHWWLLRVPECSSVIGELSTYYRHCDRDWKQHKWFQRGPIFFLPRLNSRTSGNDPSTFASGRWLNMFLRNAFPDDIFGFQTSVYNHFFCNNKTRAVMSYWSRPRSLL